MKRVLSAALVVMILAPLFPSFSVADSEPSLPACCRKDGKHHCAMMAAFMSRHQRKESSSVFRGAPEQCPFRTTVLQCSVRHGFLCFPSTSAFGVPNAIQAALSPETDHRPHAVEALYSLQRGPPQLS